MQVHIKMAIKEHQNTLPNFFKCPTKKMLTNKYIDSGIFSKTVTIANFSGSEGDESDDSLSSYDQTENSSEIGFEISEEKGTEKIEEKGTGFHLVDCPIIDVDLCQEHQNEIETNGTQLWVVPRFFEPLSLRS